MTKEEKIQEIKNALEDQNNIIKLYKHLLLSILDTLDETKINELLDVLDEN